MARRAAMPAGTAVISLGITNEAQICSVDCWDAMLDAPSTAARNVIADTTTPIRRAIWPVRAISSPGVSRITNTATRTRDPVAGDAPWVTRRTRKADHPTDAPGVASPG